MKIRTIFFLGFPAEERSMLKRATKALGGKKEGISLMLANTHEGADLVIVNGSSNVITGNGTCVALVKDNGDFYRAKKAGAIAAYPNQKSWESAAIVLRGIVADIEALMPSLGLQQSH